MIHVAIGILPKDVLLMSFKFLELYDIFAFIKSNKNFWKIKRLNQLFKEYYYDADIAFVALAWKCYEINQKEMFINLCDPSRKYIIMIYQEFFWEKI